MTTNDHSSQNVFVGAALFFFFIKVTMEVAIKDQSSHRVYYKNRMYQNIITKISTPVVFHLYFQHRQPFTGTLIILWFPCLMQVPYSLAMKVLSAVCAYAIHYPHSTHCPPDGGVNGLDSDGRVSFV